MPYYKFDTNDVFVNTLKLYPEVKFVVYSGSAYYNSTPDISGAFVESIRCTDPGSVSLFEMNIDRSSASVATRAIGIDEIPDTGLVRPWIVKDGSRMNFRTSNQASFIDTDIGEIIYGASYPYTASISKDYYTALTPRAVQASFFGDDASGGMVMLSPGSVSIIRMLKNTINYYRYLSPQFEYSSSANSITNGVHSRDFDSSSLGLVSIPSIFYGNQIKKGSVNLEFYYTGSLIARAQDTKRNGELIQTFGVDSNNNGVIGLVLYNEGFIILTSSVALATAASNDNYTGVLDQPRWTYFAQSISGSITAPKSTFIMQMSGTSDTQVVTMFATAPKGDLNHSNNPTYLSASNLSFVSTGSSGYIENEKRTIKNIVSSAYADPAGSFEKTTYISKVGVFDKNKNLIGVAKVATPVKKTVNRDFTFKIQLDI